MKKEMIVLTLVTLYLIVYSVLGQIGISIDILFSMFFFSPFLVIWLVVSVLKSKNSTYASLKNGEEWGYRDKSKDELGAF